MSSRVADVSPLRQSFRDVIERLLPWYDPEAARAAEERSERIRQSAIRARINAENVRRDYNAMARRLTR